MRLTVREGLWFVLRLECAGSAKLRVIEPGLAQHICYFHSLFPSLPFELAKVTQLVMREGLAIVIRVSAEPLFFAPTMNEYTVPAAVST